MIDCHSMNVFVFLTGSSHQLYKAGSLILNIDGSVLDAQITLKM